MPTHLNPFYGRSWSEIARGRCHPHGFRKINGRFLWFVCMVIRNPVSLLSQHEHFLAVCKHWFSREAFARELLRVWSLSADDYQSCLQEQSSLSWVLLCWSFVAVALVPRRPTRSTFVFAGGYWSQPARTSWMKSFDQVAGLYNRSIP